MKIQIHTIYKWGNRSVNSYYLPSTDLERILKEPQPKDVYYRELFITELVSNKKALELNQQAKENVK
jgi:hypothetical protein